MKRRISPLTGIANRTTKVPITPKGSFFPAFPRSRSLSCLCQSRKVDGCFSFRTIERGEIFGSLFTRLSFSGRYTQQLCARAGETWHGSLCHHPCSAGAHALHFLQFRDRLECHLVPSQVHQDRVTAAHSAFDEVVLTTVADLVELAEAPNLAGHNPLLAAGAFCLLVVPI